MALSTNEHRSESLWDRFDEWECCSALRPLLPFPQTVGPPDAQLNDGKRVPDRSLFWRAIRAFNLPSTVLLGRTPQGLPSAVQIHHASYGEYRPCTLLNCWKEYAVCSSAGVLKTGWNKTEAGGTRADLTRHP